MNYIELINHFWQTRRTKAFSSNEADLYFALLQECNIRGWQNPFECSNRSIIATIGITEKGLIEVRNRLQVKGLIKFEKGKRKEKSPVYTLLYCNEVSINVSKTVSIKVSKNVSKKVHSFKTETETKTETNNIPLYPLKGENVSIPEIQTLDSENEEKEKKVPAKKEKFRVPSMHEVQNYCNERENGISAFTFINFYQSKGWKVGNQPMKDWKAAVRTWEQKRNGDGTNKSNSNATQGRNLESLARNIEQGIARGSK